MKKNTNFQFGFIKSEQGYTLIELLAVIIVLVVVGSIIISILVSSLRGNNRSTTVNDIRQSGDFTLSQMSKMIQYARSFDGVSTGQTDDSGNLIYTTDCTVSSPPSPTPSPAPTNYSYIRITSFDGGQTVFSCSGNPETIASSSASNAISLVDVSSVSVSSCYFLCTQNNILTAPTIDINFTLTKSAAGVFSENQISIPFETSVIPRNNGN